MKPEDKECLEMSGKDFKDVIKKYVKESFDYILIIYTKDDSIALSTLKPEKAKERLCQNIVQNVKMK